MAISLKEFSERAKWPDGRFGSYPAGTVINESLRRGNPGGIEVGLCNLPKYPQRCDGAITIGCKSWLLGGLFKLHEAGEIALEEGQLEGARIQRQRFSTGPCGDIPESIKQEVWSRVDEMIAEERASPGNIGETFDLGNRVYRRMIEESPEEWGRLDPPKWK